jgi:hypothetical protein
MRNAVVNGKVVVARPDAPDVALCPDCKTEVQKRRRKCMDGRITYFYRHERGEGKDCPRRYRPA